MYAAVTSLGPASGSCAGCETHTWAHGDTYTERNIRTDPDALAQLRQLGYSCVPVPVVGNAVTDGLDMPALHAALGS